MSAYRTRGRSGNDESLPHARATVGVAKTRMVRRSGIPDMRYINQKVPIAEVARSVGPTVRRHYQNPLLAVEGHPRGDRTANAAFIRNTVT